MTTTRVLASGLHFAEAPRWHDGELWFSDFFDYAVKTVDLDGRVAVKVSMADRPSGLGWLPDGRLLIVSMTARALLRLDGDHLVVHADLSGIATFHCNDMVVDALGRAYVGNFGFDLDTSEINGTLAEVLAAHEGATLARVDPDGSVHAAADGLMFPNGTVITPDGRTMIVAETFGKRLTAFDIAADGGLSNRRVWADLGRRKPDGICLDEDGAVWVANPETNECVRVAEGGEILDVIETDNRCFACMLGGPDRRTLFMLTSRHSLAVEAAVRRTANVLVAEVDCAGAGRP
ncbi:MAG TPA: SMP-30/gluconolactonase/LRE family protein [Ilumatobacteraceae bacterium]|jgi:sugar lactone lactonase YvrE